jgi:hypothetical protein
MPPESAHASYGALLPGVRHEVMAFAASGRLTGDVTQFATQVITRWDLAELRPAALTTATELVGWILAHGPSTVLRVALTLDRPLVHIEVFDRGGLVPDPNVAAADAAFAVRLLTPPCVEWGAGLDSRGRCLWATLHVASDHEPVIAESSEAGP